MRKTKIARSDSLSGDMMRLHIAIRKFKRAISKTWLVKTTLGGLTSLLNWITKEFLK